MEDGWGWRTRLPADLGPALVALPLLFGAPALAQDQAPDMRGRWKMEPPAIVLGARPHHPSTAAPPLEPGKPRLPDFVGMLQIEG